jgi:hypothetical protein
VPCLLWLVATLSPRRHLIRSQINSCEIYGGRNSTETRSVIENVINWTFRNTKHIWEYRHKFLLKSASLAYRGTNLCLVGVDGRWLINNFYNHRIKINRYFIAPVAFSVDFDWLVTILFNRGLAYNSGRELWLFLAYDRVYVYLIKIPCYIW